MDPRAILFVPLMAASWIVGVFVSACASHFFLTIVESSATAYVRNMPWKGQPFREWIRDGVNWPEELLIDYFAKLFYLAYIIGIWAGPAFITGRLIAGHSPLATVITGVAFWLLFPIGLLSSLASASRWTPFRPAVVGAFFKRPVKTLAFYVLSAPVLALVFLTFDIILLRVSSLSVVWSIALTPFAVMAFFLYARLVGRLGLIVSFTRPQEIERVSRPRKRKRSKRPLNAYDPVARQFGPTEETFDSPLAPIQTPYDGELTGYDVDDSGEIREEEPRPQQMIHKFDDEDDSPIGVEPVAEIAGTDRERVARELATPSEREIAFYMHERPKEPRNPYGSESLLFLLDPKTISPWIQLTLGIILLALFQRGLDSLRPE